jgi:2-methylcitrate dehydratase PrpD
MTIAASLTEPTIGRRLGAFVAGLRPGDVPATVDARVADLIAYGLVVAAAGITTGFGAQAEAAVASTGEGGPARSLQRPRALTAPAAAFVNGTLMQARGQEDTHGTFHVGAAAIPAALAVGEELDVSAEALRTAIVAGYEAGIALSGPLTVHTTPPHRATGMFGAVAAAAATSHVLGLSAERTTAALAMASAMSGGTTEWTAAGTHECRFQGGWAAMSGVLAARLAAAGIAASPSAFEGPGGFLACYAPLAEPALSDSVGAELGERWQTLNVTFKPYPVCAFNQSAALAALRLAARGLDPAAIAAIRVSMPTREATYLGVDFGGPFTTLEQTQMSVQLCVAAALTHRSLAFAQVQPKVAAPLAHLIAATQVVPVAGWEGKRTRVEVDTTSGRTFVEAVDDPVRELSWDRITVREFLATLANETHLSAPAVARLATAAELADAATIVDAYWDPN